MISVDPVLAPVITFKGGTSLSKVFDVIDRFSEDVDLSLSPEYVGASHEAFDEDASGRANQRVREEIERRCREKVESDFVPHLESMIQGCIGVPAGGATWLEKVTTETGAPGVRFNYPSVIPSQSTSIEKSVLLEPGSLAESWPTGLQEVRPWISETVPSLFANWVCSINTLNLERSFWEKVTILHSEFYRPIDKPFRKDYSRHYYDVVKILDHPNADVFIEDKELAQRVVRWKMLTYPSSWSNYHLARHGSFRLAPSEQWRETLRADYERYSALYIGEPLPFDDLVESLKSAEERINHVWRT